MSHTNICGGVRVSNSPVCWQSRGWRMISNLLERCQCLKFGKKTWIWSWQWRVIQKATHLDVELNNWLNNYSYQKKGLAQHYLWLKYLLRWLLSFANKSFPLLFSEWRTFEALVSLCIRKQSLVCFSQLFSVLACTGRLTALQSTGIVVNCKSALYLQAMEVLFSIGRCQGNFTWRGPLF